MGLVDYSESESDSEVSAKQIPKPAFTATGTPTGSTKKPFQKVVDRSNPGKIRVNLPLTQSEDRSSTGDEPPPAKRARTGGGGGGGGLFGGLNSFLPAPKNASKPSTTHNKSSAGGSSRPVFQLKTSSEAGFSREAPTPPEDGDDAAQGDNTSMTSSGLKLPQPKAPAQPSIPEGMKAEDDVKLVGKPIMFRPLSVARNKKKPVKKNPTPSPAPAASTSTSTEPIAKEANDNTPAPAPPKKVSLFSFNNDADATPDDTSSASNIATTPYEPLFDTQTSATNPYDSYAAADPSAYADHPTPTTAPNSNNDSLASIANEMNLSVSQRRELFGRDGSSGPSTASQVINFNTDREYQHNEELRAAGQQQIHNPVRAIAPGKHNLKQLVNAVQNQRDAHEESFAKGKTNRKEASGRYGW